MKLGSKKIFGRLTWKKTFLSLFTACLFLAYNVVNVAAFTVPDYQGPVNDYASVIGELEENELEVKLIKEAAQENGVEIAVVTLTNLGQEPVENVSQQIFDSWKIGKAGLHNGVLLLITIEDRQLRIQTGYGAEVFLTDSVSGAIIRDKIVPFLKESNYSGAVMAGVDSILEKAHKIDQKELVPSKKSGVSDWLEIGELGIFALMFLGSVFTYVVSFLGRSKSWWLGGVIGAATGWIVAQATGATILGIIGLLLDYILSSNFKHWNLDHKTTSWRNTWGGFHTSGGSGFKFGGGMSGGGGASGKW